MTPTLRIRVINERNLRFKFDELVKSRFSLPWREGIKGRGILTHGNYYIYPPSPPPSPIEGEGVLTFYEVVKFLRRLSGSRFRVHG